MSDTMFFIEYALQHSLAGVDREDVSWNRYPRQFTQEKQAEDEAWWLSEWDDQFAYRVIEVTE